MPQPPSSIPKIEQYLQFLFTSLFVCGIICTVLQRNKEIQHMKKQDLARILALVMAAILLLSAIIMPALAAV